jgi:CRISPR/Cas system-associated exonuclease Cas4 (RecB family)
MQKMYGSRTYEPNAASPFKISRTKIQYFLECPRCFYLDRRLGIVRPSGPGFSLNSAVDTLLKREFDQLRGLGQAHEIMKRYGVDAVPYVHQDLDVWRENFTGKQYLHEPTNLIIFGSVDDLWINPKGELIVVDYKSTSTESEISLDDQWKQGYKKQLEIYQWIFRRCGFVVSQTAYIVYANASKNRSAFDGRLEFALTLHPHKGDDSWVEPVIFQIKDCLELKRPPDSQKECEYCKYRQKASTLELSGQLGL